MWNRILKEEIERSQKNFYHISVVPLPMGWMRDVVLAGKNFAQILSQVSSSASGSGGALSSRSSAFLEWIPFVPDVL